MRAGVSASQSAYVLEVLGEASRVVQEIHVSGYARIGRSTANNKVEVSIPDACVSASRQHAVIDLRGDRPLLEDQSRYGTMLNGSRIEHGVGELSDGDEILFGMPGDGWRVRFRYLDRLDETKNADPLELLTVSENPRQVRIGATVIEENLGRDAFILLRFLSKNKGKWFPKDRLVDLVWPDPDKTPIAALGALSQAKRRINDLLSPHLNGQDPIVTVPFRGYCMKPHLDVT